MGHSRRDDTRSYEDLAFEIDQLGWNIGDLQEGSDFVVLQLRAKPYTSTFEGMTEKRIVGKTPEDAMRNFLAEQASHHDDGPSSGSEAE